MGEVTKAVIEMMGKHYPELVQFREAIEYHISNEEQRFQRTLEMGLSLLDEIMQEMTESKTKVLAGEQAFYLHATHGFPMEISRDILKENQLDVDEEGFQKAVEAHREDSRSEQGTIAGQEVYRTIRADLQASGALPESGVEHDPYGEASVETTLLAIVNADGEHVKSAKKGEMVEIILAKTPFYVEGGWSGERHGSH